MLDQALWGYPRLAGSILESELTEIRRDNLMEREKGEELSSPFLILDELNATPPRAEPADVGDNFLNPNRLFSL